MNSKSSSATGLRCIILAVLVAAGPLAVAEDASLELKLKKGETQKFALEWTTTRHWAIKAQPPGALRQIVKLRWHQEVRAVSDAGVATLARRFEALRLEVASGLLDVCIDTRKPDADHAGKHGLLYRMAREVIGGEIAVDVDRRGRVLRTRGVKKILDRIRAKFGKETWAPLYVGMIENAISPDRTSHPWVAHWFALEPEVTSSGGATEWRKTLPLSVFTPARKIDLEFRSRRKSRSDTRHGGLKCARFAIDGRLHGTPGGESSTEIAGVRYVTRVTKSKASGEALFARDSGLLSRARMSFSYSLTHRIRKLDSEAKKDDAKSAPIHSAEKADVEIFIERVVGE